jgi:predicted nuclease of predicted toxin-antitoxin system
MKICVDENIPLSTVSELRSLGHDVLDIRGTSDQGLSDDLLWAMAQREGRVLLTTDKGFAEHRSETHHGVLIVRLRQPNEQKIHDRAMRGITQFSQNEWSGLTLVMRDAVQSISRGR